MTEPLETTEIPYLPAVRGADALVRPAAETAAIKQSFRAYTELCDQLLDKSDYQRIGNKEFRKKSGWRKLAVAFGVSCEMREEVETRDDQGHIIRARLVVRAVAPNGRYMDGLGICDVHEKCCDPEWCSKRGDHKHCKTGCPGWVHFSGVEHDIPATAFTRAANRACADLFGMGEVSAEEISNPDRGNHESGESTTSGTAAPKARVEAAMAAINTLPTGTDRGPFFRFVRENGRDKMSVEAVQRLEKMIEATKGPTETPPVAPAPPVEAETGAGPQAPPQGHGKATRPLVETTAENPCPFCSAHPCECLTDQEPARLAVDVEVTNYAPGEEPF